MAVDTVSSATSTNATSSSKASSAAASASLDYDAFLQLLIAQMQNQDPTDPLDASEQISQLATFSQVEQSIQTNTNLESLIAQSSLSNASSYIGKTITSSDGKTSGVVESIEVTSDGLVATTDAGKEITIGDGITISATKSSES
ncbi:flagellar hook assembly protein FlgD [Neorhizobium sp. AL 9.2.2]|uniref:flagellar hook assembly protein FlgD n=1 Tax=Neorhizobium sp. AL 9.2.2 TaxID=2712894 RepID=UPI00157291E7|nr:flagellar hook assembly protein FlgD [Neorhizobium sp. AL 9.2.2]NSY16241.1 flagellar hook assembly protein FlgD [Neorhizobium sp. AL 9.2.2]